MQYLLPSQPTIITEKTTISRAELALILGVHESRIGQLATDGIAVKVENNKYELTASVQNFIKFHKDRVESLKAASEDDAKKRMALAKANIAELDLAERKGELVDKTIALSVFSEACIVAKTRLMAMSSKIAQAVRVAKDDKTAKLIIDKQVKSALYSLASIKSEDLESYEIE
ncbi:MAG: hypothetical protein AAGI66_09050 [Cyanobacteria bacterium P01_H01_bin.74]